MRAWQFWLLSAWLVAATAQAAVPTAERQVLINLYTGTSGPSWSNSTGWTTAPGVFNVVGTECSWSGIVCDGAQAHVVEIVLASNNLSGTLPAIGDLTNLQGFVVTANKIGGALPAIAHLSSLVIFDAGTNQFSGNLPDFTDLPALTYFNAMNNQLVGSIPDLSGAPNLNNFGVSSNQLTGTIPDLSALTKLADFAIDRNNISGPVPVAPSALAVGNAALCPNPLDTTPSANDAAWSTATGFTPWWATPYATNKCDDTFTSGFD